jgi:putative membrane protein
LGSQINHVFEYYLIGMVTALTFTAIMQFLVAAFGFVGRFIAVLLLTLQLTSSSGTFPVETSMPLFQWLHPFMPMTYSTDALREAMTGLNMQAAMGDVGILLIFAVVFFLLTAVVAYYRRMVTMPRLHPLLDI